MARHDDHDKKNKINDIDEDEGDSESGSGSQNGSIEFHDFLASIPSRDDFLSDAEIDQLLSVHEEFHKTEVKKQKDTRIERELLKQQKLSQTAYHGLSQGGFQAGFQSSYQVHPISLSVQFSGLTDSKVNAMPDKNMSNTNAADRKELQNRYTPQMVPSFHPKPKR